MIERVLETIAKNDLLDTGEKILLAVSGGIDSMVLAHIYLELEYEVIWAHCNFQLRGEESDQDELFVQSMAEKYGIAFFSKKFESEVYAQESGFSIQEAARNLRYEWFNELAEEQNCQKICTAHHANDRIETLLINLTRSTGLRGLQGIPVRRGNIIRPLLYSFKNEIEEYATVHGITFREDSSNESDKYLRNEIRHHLVPVLINLNPNFEKQITESMEHIKSMSGLIDNGVQELMADISQTNQNEVIIDIEKLKLLDHQKVLFNEFLYRKGFNYSVIDQIWESLDGQAGKVFYASNYLLLKDRSTLVIKGRFQNFNKEYIINELHNIETPMSLRFEKYLPSEITSRMDKHIEYFDADQLALPLIIRRWRAGDRFIPIGMKGTKKLSDYFVDEKLSLFDKENTWLLISRNKIAWVMGHRVSDEFKITPRTREAIKITLGE